MKISLGDIISVRFRSIEHGMSQPTTVYEQWVEPKLYIPGIPDHVVITNNNDGPITLSIYQGPEKKPKGFVNEQTLSFKPGQRQMLFVNQAFGVFEIKAYVGNDELELKYYIVSASTIPSH